MRRMGGIWGVIGLFALGTIFLFGLMFIPQIFGQIEAKTSTPGTVYGPAFNMTRNITWIFGAHGLPVVVFFVFILGIAAGVVFLARARRR